MALSNRGTVFVWGGNRKGQLGDGQLTSSNTPLKLKELRHRPIIKVVCGEAHTLAVTVTGNLYAWGDNSSGQLGLGDETNRLRPELVRSVRSSRVAQCAAGRQHTVLITRVGGLTMAFGSNSHGQCGAALDVKKLNTPSVVERLRELKGLDVCCGSAHTLVICTESFSSSSSFSSNSTRRIFGFGLNSSGQLGLGKASSSVIPTQLSLEEGQIVRNARSGPLAFHSFLFLEDSVHLREPELPAVDLQSLTFLTRRLNDSARTLRSPSGLMSAVEGVLGTGEGCRVLSEEEYNSDVRELREHIAAAFSSIAVINASFYSTTESQGGKGQGITNSSELRVDLKQVRRAYEQILSTDNELVLNTLGRATLQLSDSLKECQFDDSENLSVFLIVLENPLLLKPMHYQIVLERVITGILAVPKTYRYSFNFLVLSFLYPQQYFRTKYYLINGIN